MPRLPSSCAAAAVATGMLLLIGAGCATPPLNPSPNDPFTAVEPGLSPRTSPSVPAQSSPSYRMPLSTPAAPPRRAQPNRIAPPNGPKRATPPQTTPRTFADPEPAPPSTTIPPNRGNGPRKPVLPDNPPTQSPPVDGPQLSPPDDGTTAAKTSSKAANNDGPVELRVDIPDRRPVGSGVPLQLTVRNLSDQVLRNVSLVCEFDPALSFPGSDRKSVTHKIPRIDPGDMKESLLTLVSETAGLHPCRFSVNVGSQTVLKKSVMVEFVSRQLDWQVHGPIERTVGSRAEFNIPLINISRRELRQLTVRVEHDAALAIREMTQGGRIADRSVTWTIDRLAANEGMLLQLEVECREITKEACLKVFVSGEDLPEDSHEACLVVKPRSGWLDVRVHDVSDPIGVGETAEFVVTIQNQGLQTVKDVAATCTLPDGFELVHAAVKQGERSRPVTAEVQGGAATLGEAVVLPPDKSVEYRLTVRARHAGMHQVTISVAGPRDQPPVDVVEPIMVHR